MAAPVPAQKIFSTERVVALIAILVAVLFGFLIGDDSASVRKLQEEIDGLQSELDQSKQDQQAQMLTRSSAARLLSRAPADSPRFPDLEEPPVQSEEWRRQEGSKIHQRFLEEHVARTAAERANDDAAVLSDLGLEPGAVSQVQSNLTELHRKAIAAGDPLGELVLERDKYDKEMRSLLGEDNYHRYREYEERKPAVREYEMLTEYAVKQGLPLDPVHADPIIGLMKEAGATTTETWHGPYDPLPRPATGDQLIERMRADYTSLIESANALLDAAGQSALPDATFELLYDYYAAKEQERYDQMLFVDRPVEEIRADMRARVDEQLRKMQERRAAGQQ